MQIGQEMRANGMTSERVERGGMGDGAGRSGTGWGRMGSGVHTAQSQNVVVEWVAIVLGHDTMEVAGWVVVWDNDTVDSNLDLK